MKANEAKTLSDTANTKNTSEEYVLTMDQIVDQATKGNYVLYLNHAIHKNTVKLFENDGFVVDYDDKGFNNYTKISWEKEKK